MSGDGEFRDELSTTAFITCPCPPLADGSLRHPAGDTVELRPALDFRAGMTARNAIGLAREENGGEISSAEALTILTEVYILQGVSGWSLVDEKGKPLPVTRPNLRAKLLSDQTRAMAVGDVCDALYAEAVMVPLLMTGSSSSPPTPTNGSTSAKSGLSPVRRMPSKRSSTSTSPTGAIEPTTALHAGASSSSQS